MNKFTIHPFDWQRMLVGDVPAAFYGELAIRTLFVYVGIFVAMRLMGKRVASHLSRNELSGVATLAAATGIILMTPQRGLLPSFTVLCVVVALHRLISYYSLHHRKFDRLHRGELGVLVKQGVLQYPAMTKSRISKEQVMAVLRGNEVQQLGAVKRLYMEANGSFSLVKQTDPPPGLSVIPDLDKQFLAEQAVEETLVCHRCGHGLQPPASCPECGGQRAVHAVTHVILS